MSNNILSAFNEHFIEFVNDVQSVFPNDVDINNAKNSLLLIKKANPKMIVKIWKSCIADKYKSEIENGDINFFINKDYSSDLVINDNSDKIMQCIDRFRRPIKDMSDDNKLKTIKYIQNLTKLSELC